MPASPTAYGASSPAATGSASSAVAVSPAPSASPPATKRATPSRAATDGTRFGSIGASSAPSCAEATLARLSEGQRIGQLFLLGIGGSRLDASELAAIRADHFGSVWLANARTGGAGPVRALAGAVQALAPAATGGIRFFVGTDQEGGFVQRLSGPGFSAIPPALRQGALAPAVLRADAASWGRQLAAAGINLDFAPVADVVPPGTDASNAPIGALAREYGHDPGAVASHVTAFVAGLRSAGVAATLKHFPGLGRVTGNTDFTSGVLDSLTTANDPYLAPFRAGIAAGASFVMVSLARYARLDPNNLAVFSRTVIGGLLRSRLGFDGVVVSDSLGGTAAVASIDPGLRAVGFVAAGGDMVLVDTVGRAEAMAAAIELRAAADAAFRAEVNAAALRVLQAKAEYGLVACRG